MKKILVAGGSGNLGEKIIHALVDKGAEVHAIVRSTTAIEKVKKLEKMGVKVLQVKMNDIQELSHACKDMSCVVSALQGLRDVVVDTQKVLLDGAIAAGVSHFIPSDFSLDFTRLQAGRNRNFDLRREFHQYLEKAPISATSIFNGAFAEILSYNIPILDMKKKTVGYWGDSPDWRLDFTTIQDTAAFTAAVALDPSAPRILNIASFQISPRELSELATEVTHSPFSLVPMGSLDKFAEYNQRERAANPAGENELYPKWQSGQYMHDMFSVQNNALDNTRYSDLKWTSGKHFISTLLN